MILMNYSCYGFDKNIQQGFKDVCWNRIKVTFFDADFIMIFLTSSSDAVYFLF